MIFSLAVQAMQAVQSTTAAAAAAPAPAVVGGAMPVPANLPSQVDLLVACDKMGPIPAVVLIIGGIVFLMFGYSIYKYLVTVNAAIIGATIGAFIGSKLGGALPGGILGGFTAAAVTWPMMRWAVAGMGGIFGALLGATLWRAAGFDVHFIWTGAMMGLILCGLLCFIVFKGSVMAYTSLQGSVMLIFGLLGLVYSYKPMADAITRGLTVKPFLLPLAIFIPTVLGLLYQQTSGAPSGPPAKK
jgi:hypothetical protein